MTIPSLSDIAANNGFLHPCGLTMPLQACFFSSSRISSSNVSIVDGLAGSVVFSASNRCLTPLTALTSMKTLNEDCETATCIDEGAAFDRQIRFAIKAFAKADRKVAKDHTALFEWPFQQQPLGHLDAGEGAVHSIKTCRHDCACWAVA